MRTWLVLGCATVGLLSGCGVMRVDNQVDSHTKWGLTAPLTGNVSYRFERTPSQEVVPYPLQLQADLEQAVATTLASAGWRLNPDAAQWRVSVTASHTALPRAPWEVTNTRRSMALGAFMEQPYHLRSVSVVVRDNTRGEVAYETQARHDGRWNNSPIIWQAMVQAALAEFPKPPAGPRVINVDIPR